MVQRLGRAFLSQLYRPLYQVERLLDGAIRNPAGRAFLHESFAAGLDVELGAASAGLGAAEESPADRRYPLPPAVLAAYMILTLGGAVNRWRASFLFLDREVGRIRDSIDRIRRTVRASERVADADLIRLRLLANEAASLIELRLPGIRSLTASEERTPVSV